MFQTQPKYRTYVLQNAHTGEIVAAFPTRREALAAKDTAGDHALRVRGGKAILGGAR